MYDAIVIGARCAGSPTAMLLARDGHRVLLVDRARFPSDTMSTHLIHPPGLASLKRWGLLDELLATGCPKLESLRCDFGEVKVDGPQPMDFGPVAIEGLPAAADGISWYCGPRRKVLDPLLVEAAVEAGAELREGTALRELVFDDGHVAGVRLSTDGGAETVERAKIVVGADGMNSTVARQVDAPTYDEGPSLTVGYYSYWSEVNDTRLTLTMHPGWALAELPTHDEQTMLGVTWPVAEFHTIRKDIEGNFMRSIVEHVPDLADRLRGATREERFKGTAVVPDFFRKPHGSGWALVGDAGYHKNPLGAHGIMDAFRDAELVAGAIDAGLSGNRPMEEALADYQATRDASSAPLYQLNMQLATLDPPPQVLGLLGAIVVANNHADLERFLGIIAGTVSVPEFLTPENIERILGEAGIPLEALAW